MNARCLILLLFCCVVTTRADTYTVGPNKAYQFLNPVSLTPEGNYQLCLPTNTASVDRVTVRIGSVPRVTEHTFKRGSGHNSFDDAHLLFETLSTGMSTVPCPSPYAEIYAAINVQLACYFGEAKACNAPALAPPSHLLLAWHGTTVGSTGNAATDANIRTILAPILEGKPVAETVDYVDDTNHATPLASSALVYALCATVAYVNM
jgi:hypothetical protein